jgi:hypothetical protein
MEYVIVLVILAMMIGWHYYSKKLDAETHKVTENQVKQDVKSEVVVEEVKADVAEVVIAVQEKVKKRKPRKKKTDNG